MSAIISCVGNLTKDAESAVIGKNNVLKFTVAVNQGFGEKKTAIFYGCTLWRGQDAIAPYLVKGTKVFVSGEFSLNEWTNKEGVTSKFPQISVNTVELIGSKKDGAEAGEAPAPAARPAARPAAKPAARPAAPRAEEIPEDDVPF